MNSAYTPSLQYGEGTYIQPQFNTAIIPAFSYVNDNLSVSTILAEYPLANTVNLSIRLPVPAVVEDNETFALCVRYTDSNSTTIRYVLNKPAWYDGILFPAYTGQGLGQSAVLEIWSLVDIGPAACTEDIELEIGPLNFQAPGQLGICGQISSTTTTLTGTEV